MLCWNEHSHPASVQTVLAVAASQQQCVREGEARGFEFRATPGYKVRFLSQAKQNRKGVTELLHTVGPRAATMFIF